MWGARQPTPSRSMINGSAAITALVILNSIGCSLLPNCNRSKTGLEIKSRIAARKSRIRRQKNCVLDIYVSL